MKKTLGLAIIGLAIVVMFSKCDKDDPDIYYPPASTITYNDTLYDVNAVTTSGNTIVGSSNTASGNTSFRSVTVSFKNLP